LTSAEEKVSTVERILRVSQVLFNDSGPATVSTNRIALELDISGGNLYYHFKNKGVIIDVLMRRFEKRLESVQSGLQSVKAVDDLWLTLHLTLEANYEYRFVFRDADYLMRTFPAVRTRLRGIIDQSLARTIALCQSLSDAGIVIASDDEQRVIAFQIVFTATCWPMFAKLTSPEIVDPLDTRRAAYQVLTLLLPYLTPDSQHYLLYLRGKYRT
jgi:AcrR family transcriptional regulator